MRWCHGRRRRQGRQRSPGWSSRRPSCWRCCSSSCWPAGSREREWSEDRRRRACGRPLRTVSLDGGLARGVVCAHVDAVVKGCSAEASPTTPAPNSAAAAPKAQEHAAASSDRRPHRPVAGARGARAGDRRQGLKGTRRSGGSSPASLFPGIPACPTIVSLSRSLRTRHRGPTPNDVNLVATAMVARERPLNGLLSQILPAREDVHGPRRARAGAMTTACGRRRPRVGWPEGQRPGMPFLGARHAT